MDLWVQNSQYHLNGTYTGVTGYEAVATDGISGWTTIYAITRALQIELGVSPRSNAFGPATKAAFDSQVGSIGSATTNAGIVALLDCALWCKGIAGSTFTGGWKGIHAASVNLLRSRMGLPTAPATVTSKMMKSLLTMDSYTLLPGGTSSVREGQQWLNSRYHTRLNFDISPTDGLYTRQMQKAMMYAIQFELGMSDSVANGNFGPGTKTGLQASGLVQLGDADATKRFVRLFQLALICNGYDIPQTGTFDLATKSATLDFQNFMEISATGKGDYGTWAALLVSTGDPDRPVTGMDTSTVLTAAAAAARYSEGYRVVGRYLTVSTKSIGPGEIQRIFSAGLKLFPIFQNHNNEAEHFTDELGYNHGVQAAIRARELGIGVTPIFFAVDYDATGDEARTIILEYFDGVKEGLAASQDVKYKIGIYATRNVCSIVSDEGRAEAVWVSGMSTGYSGNLGFKMPANWMYNQIKELDSPSLDRNAVSSRANPLTSTKPVPLKNGSFDPLFWGSKPPLPATEVYGLMKLQVMAEKHLMAVGMGDVDPASVPAFASQMVMFWFQNGRFDDYKWQAFTPSFEVALGITGNHAYAPILAARSNFFADAGSNTALEYAYAGDLRHAMATAHGVKVWGDSPRSDTVGIGDLGGWALDVVTLWVDWKNHGSGFMTNWVQTHLGGSTYQFDMGDVIADADGWLVGQLLRSGHTFGEAWRQILVTSSSNPSLRVSKFVFERFGTYNRIVACIHHLFEASDLTNSIGISRRLFLPEQYEPTPDEVIEYADAVATRLMGLI